MFGSHFHQKGRNLAFDVPAGGDPLVGLRRKTGAFAACTPLSTSLFPIYLDGWTDRRSRNYAIRIRQQERELPGVLRSSDRDRRYEVITIRR